MVCLYSKILFDHKKEHNTDMYNNTEETWKHNVKLKAYIVWFHLYNMSRKGTFHFNLFQSLINLSLFFLLIDLKEEIKPITIPPMMPNKMLSKVLI